MIRELTGDDFGVPRIPECMVVEWFERGHRVVFSFAQQGMALSAHFSAPKRSLREVKTAINDFVEWAFWAYNWCTMVLAVIGIKSVERIVKKCGFVPCAETDKYRIYMRARVAK